jgi:hypothetical protein
MRDFYKILGVSKNSTVTEIKKRFRQKALLIHPDKSGKNTKDEFIELFEAYEILSDRKKRARYDLIYDWIETPFAEPPDHELKKNIVLIHQKGLVYAEDFEKFNREVISYILIALFFALDKLLLASAATALVGVLTIAKGILSLKVDYALVGVIIALFGVCVGKMKFDRVVEELRL